MAEGVRTIPFHDLQRTLAAAQVTIFFVRGLRPMRALKGLPWPARLQSPLPHDNTLSRLVVLD